MSGTKSCSHRELGIREGEMAKLGCGWHAFAMSGRSERESRVGDTGRRRDSAGIPHRLTLGAEEGLISLCLRETLLLHQICLPFSGAAARETVSVVLSSASASASASDPREEKSARDSE